MAGAAANTLQWQGSWGKTPSQEVVLDAKPHITCRELVDFIMSYLDHELPPDQRAEFDRHMAVCPSCVDYLKTYEKTVLLAKSCADDPVPDEVPESLVQAILEARKKI